VEKQGKEKRRRREHHFDFFFRQGGREKKVGEKEGGEGKGEGKEKREIHGHTLETDPKTGKKKKKGRSEKVEN